MVGILRLHPCAKDGADDQDRTGDLVLTKDVLCQLSYIGLRATLTSLSPRFGRQVGPPHSELPDYPKRAPITWLANRSSRSERRLERETGIEPATNSLEGCDSTTELLPPSRLARSAPLGATAGKPAVLVQRSSLSSALPPCASARRRPSRGATAAGKPTESASWLANRRTCLPSRSSLVKVTGLACPAEARS
jgi:hypothetical protein